MYYSSLYDPRYYQPARTYMFSVLVDLTTAHKLFSRDACSRNSPAYRHPCSKTVFTPIDISGPNFNTNNFKYRKKLKTLFVFPSNFSLRMLLYSSSLNFCQWFFDKTSNFFPPKILGTNVNDILSHNSDPGRRGLSVRKLLFSFRSVVFDFYGPRKVQELSQNRVVFQIKLYFWHLKTVLRK